MRKIHPLFIGGVLAFVAVAASAQNRPAGPGNNPAAIQVMAAQAAADYMARLDTNRDGKVTWDEYVAPLRKQFLDADTNHDGVLTKDELTVAIAKAMNEAVAAELARTAPSPLEYAQRPIPAPVDIPVAAPGAFAAPAKVR